MALLEPVRVETFADEMDFLAETNVDVKIYSPTLVTLKAFHGLLVDMKTGTPNPRQVFTVRATVWNRLLEVPDGIEVDIAIPIGAFAHAVKKANGCILLKLGCIRVEYTSVKSGRKVPIYGNVLIDIKDGLGGQRYPEACEEP